MVLNENYVYPYVMSLSWFMHLYLIGNYMIVGGIVRNVFFYLF